MLSTADAALAGRDGAIPALPRLLDADAFAETLSRLYPDAGVTAAEPRYVRYKRGTSCLVGYRVTGAAGVHELYARAHNPAVDAKVEKAAQRESVPSPLGGGIAVLPEEAVVVYPFPNDHELPALRAFGDGAARETMLGELVPGRDAARAGRLERLRYKPERRCVARLAVPDGPGAVVRFYTRADYPLVRDNPAIFDSEPPLRVPRRLGRSKRFRASAVEWMEGESLRDAMRRGDAPASALRTVGAALARLHGQKSKRIQVVHSAESYAKLLAEAAAAVAEIAPALAGRAAGLAGRMGDRIVRRHWRTRRTIHGDLSADQIILQDGAAAVVDFDRASYGDPRLDLGTLEARLICDALCGALDAAGAADAFGTVLEAYREASAKDVTRKLPRFTAMGLLLCAVEPFRYRHADWPAAIDAVLARAEALAGEGVASDA